MCVSIIGACRARWKNQKELGERFELAAGRTFFVRPTTPHPVAHTRDTNTQKSFRSLSLQIRRAAHTRATQTHKRASASLSLLVAIECAGGFRLELSEHLILVPGHTSGRFLR